MSESQEYTYESDLNGNVYIFRRQPDGRYREKGGGRYCLIGTRQAYHDFSF